MSPAKCIVAPRGTTKSKTSSLILFFLTHSSVTGIVAAEDWVPTAVKYPGIWFFNIFKGFLPVTNPAVVNCIIKYTICNGITTKYTLQNILNIFHTCPAYVIFANVPAI